MSIFTYPGVYIQELPSGVHSITGVATSIAAFVGWAPQGPVTETRLVESWSDYQATYGGLDARSMLGYSVNQFFGNGGQQAYIVRLVWDGTITPAAGTNPTAAATAVAAGVGYATSQITASQGAIVSPAATLRIGTPVLQSITITPAALPPLPLGGSITFVANGNFSDGSKAVLAGAVWTSSNASVVAITTSGAATAAGAGSAVLTATSGLISSTVTVTVSAAGLSGITVTPATPVLAAGEAPVAGQPQVGPTQQLSATGSYTDGTTRDLTSVATWSSLNPLIAAVNGTGLVTASSTTGPTTITAAWAGSNGTSSVTVNAASVVAIVIHPGAPVIIATPMVKEVINFTASAIFSDNSTGPLPAAAAWVSSNTAVATIVGTTGAATAVAPGSTTITVTSGGLTAHATLTVTAATLNAISITPITPSVAVGLTVQLKATGIYSDGTTADFTANATWATGGPDATVNATTGVVTGVTVNPSVAVTATWTPVTGTTVTSAPVNVAVTAPVLQSLAITPTPPISLASGGSSQLTATGKFSDGTTADLTNSVTWTSSNPGAATVSATGLALAVASGGSLTLFAANPGAWGNNLRISITPQAADPTRFSLLVQQVTATGQLQTVESFNKLSTTTTDPNYVVTVIDSTSQYISFIDPGTGNPVVPTSPPAGTPAGTPIALNGGADGAALVPASDQNFELAMTFDPTKGVFLLDRVDIFNLLCVPGETDAPTISTLQAYCAAKRAFYIVDAPKLATYASLQMSGPVGSTSGSITSGPNAANSAFYYPWIKAPDPLFGNRPTLFPPCGFVAGIYATTDASRGVWKAPAGIQAALTGVSGLQFNLTDLENGDLNIQAINCLREFKIYGDVVWGARTLQGNDQAGSEWKYIPIRRLALYIESSLYDGTQWVVFEPNDEPLWGQIRLNVGAFMKGLFLQGAFQGSSPAQAYFVKCDADNNPQASINLGIVNILVGFAPLNPAEFVVIQIQQIAGQLS